MLPCDSSKYNCGLIIPSSCVPYTGADLMILTPQTQLACNANINDVIGAFDNAVSGLLTSTNLTGLNPQCLSFDPATINVSGLFQVNINKICALDASLSALQTLFNDLNIATMPIAIDLQCLAPGAAPCLTPPNTYQLQAVLNVMLSEICALKTAVGI